MEDITQKLKKLAKFRMNTKLIYKQSDQRFAKLFVDDLSVK